MVRNLASDEENLYRAANVAEAMHIDVMNGNSSSSRRMPRRRMREALGERAKGASQHVSVA